MGKSDNNGDNLLPVSPEDIKQTKAENKNLIVYTGNSSRQLIVHICQKNGERLLEVDKPIKTKIYEQSVMWRMRQYPIVPSRFVYDYQGIAHQYTDVNDVSVLTWNKDHEDNCISCGGKMTVDARESRALGRKGIFHNIWGLDNTHIMLMLVFVIGAMAMAGAFFWAYMNDTKHTAELNSAREDIKEKNLVIERYYNMTGIQLG